jgi:hypothetical protein
MQHGIRGPMPLGYYLSPEMNFIISLVNIGDRLVQLTTREMRKAQLYADLTLINLNLPARVYLPVLLSQDSPQHHVVRIPPQESVILNSKDRVCLGGGACLMSPGIYASFITSSLLRVPRLIAA